MKHSNTTLNFELGSVMLEGIGHSVIKVYCWERSLYSYDINHAIYRVGWLEGAKTGNLTFYNMGPLKKTNKQTNKKNASSSQLDALTPKM